MDIVVNITQGIDYLRSNINSLEDTNVYAYYVIIGMLLHPNNSQANIYNVAQQLPEVKTIDLGWLMTGSRDESIAKIFRLINSNTSLKYRAKKVIPINISDLEPNKSSKLNYINLVNRVGTMLINDYITDDLKTTYKDLLEERMYGKLH
jgi:hypothetical protein